MGPGLTSLDLRAPPLARDRRPAAPPQAAERHLFLTVRTNSAATAAAARFVARRIVKPCGRRFFSVMSMAPILRRRAEND